MIDVASHLAKN